MIEIDFLFIDQSSEVAAHFIFDFEAVIPWEYKTHYTRSFISSYDF